MVHKQFNLTVALKNDVITNINDVESGLKCGCICPACKEPLVAKKGKKMMHHFAHHAGHSCESGYESSLHLAAKGILSGAKRMTLPAVYVSFPDSYKKDEPVCSAKEIEIDKVELEQRFGDVIPDVVVHAGGKQFFVEIYITQPSLDLQYWHRFVPDQLLECSSGSPPILNYLTVSGRKKPPVSLNRPLSSRPVK